MKQLPLNDENLDSKNSTLDVVRVTLKAEFVGIDEVIDRVIDSISNWYLFPELQESPVVINLWGMTGVGKTALIVRIAELLDFDKKLFRYDMGNNAERNTSLKEILKEIFSLHNGMPAMIMLDEFQYAKTKNEKDAETDNPFSRVIWDLLDSGKFQSYQSRINLSELIETKDTLQEAIDNGVKTEKGLVTENLDSFIEVIEARRDEFYENEVEYAHKVRTDGEPHFQFLPRKDINNLYQCFKDKTSIKNFKHHLTTLNEKEIIQLYDKAIEIAQSSKWVDCTKCIIFILGNLDEAYTMSSTFNPDINANEFHESSRNININHIKFALRNRFRNEQISRLGNNHIIYPAFNEASFYALIKMKLKNVADKYLEQFSIELTFTKDFVKLIYAEGVFPTQGTRPLFSTIYQMVNVKMPLLLSENILKKLNADTIVFDTDGDKMIYEYFSAGISVYLFREKALLNLSRLRKPEKDDMQALVAVHEAGHAVISIAGLKIIPEYLCSTSSDVGSAGITVVKNKWKYLAKDELVYRIAENLSGIVAEKLIFGAQKISRGAGHDIETATKLATSAIKEYGMGSIFADLNIPTVHTRDSLHDLTGEYNNEVKMLLNKGAELAEMILLQEKKLLLQLADYLSEERIIKKKEIEEKVRTYGSEAIKNISFIENGDHLFYRAKLKKEVSAVIDEAPINLIGAGMGSISLNKNE